MVLGHLPAYDATAFSCSRRRPHTRPIRWLAVDSRLSGDVGVVYLGMRPTRMRRAAMTMSLKAAAAASAASAAAAAVVVVVD